MTATPRRSLTVTLPIPSGQLGPNGRAHWRKKAELFKAAKERACWEFLAEMQELEMMGRWLGDVSIDIRWVATQDNHLPDVDNLVARLKPYLDAGQWTLYENDRQVQIRSIRREVGKPARVELTFERTEE